MDDLALVTIDHTGTPRSWTGALPGVAREVCRATRDLYDTVGFEEPWVGYLCTVGTEVVGTCAYKSAPANGRVEIAYHTFPGFEGRGFASAMAAALIAIASRERPDVTVVAQTLPRPGPSTRILEKLGFRHVAVPLRPTDGEVWEWHRRGDRGTGAGPA